MVWREYLFITLWSEALATDMYQFALYVRHKSGFINILTIPGHKDQTFVRFCGLILILWS